MDSIHWGAIHWLRNIVKTHCHYDYHTLFVTIMTTPIKYNDYNSTITGLHNIFNYFFWINDYILFFVILYYNMDFSSIYYIILNFFFVFSFMFHYNCKIRYFFRRDIIRSMARENKFGKKHRVKLSILSTMTILIRTQCFQPYVFSRPIKCLFFCHNMKFPWINII